MTRARLPRINEQVSMKPEGQGRWETTVVQDLQGGLLAVATPTPYLGTGDVRPGQRWIVRYVDQAREYRFTAVVRAVEKRPVALTWLEVPEHIEELQRREHVRLEARLPARVWAEAGDEEDGPASLSRQPAGTAGGAAGTAVPGPDAGDPGLPAVTVDISGGGAQLRVAGALPAARFYRVAIQLPEGAVVTRARLVRSMEQRRPDGRIERTYAFAFDGIRMADQDRIVRFIFAEQRRLRRRGLV